MRNHFWDSPGNVAQKVSNRAKFLYFICIYVHFPPNVLEKQGWFYRFRYMLKTFGCEIKESL